jgi:hypothetical protein
MSGAIAAGPWQLHVEKEVCAGVFVTIESRNASNAWEMGDQSRSECARS